MCIYKEAFMPAVSKISETVKQQVVSDYLAGVPVSVIMSQHVVSHMQVRGILKARNTPRRRPGNPKLLQPVGKLIQPVVVPSQPVVVPSQPVAAFVPAPVPAPSLRRASRDDLAGLGQVPPASKVSTPPLPRSRKAKAPAAASPPVSQYPAEFWANAICSPEAEEAKRWGKINTQAKLNALSLEDRMAYTEWKAAQESI
jgi:hypothetical protein